MRSSVGTPTSGSKPSLIVVHKGGATATTPHQQGRKLGVTQALTATTSATAVHQQQPSVSSAQVMPKTPPSGATQSPFEKVWVFNIYSSSNVTRGSVNLSYVLIIALKYSLTFYLNCFGND